MRKLIFGINLTIDGRKTYELMVPYWPNVAKDQIGNTKAVNDFAQAFTSVENIVVCSHTLNRNEGMHTQII